MESLRDKQTVEWVCMNGGQRFHSCGVRGRYDQHRKARLLEETQRLRRRNRHVAPAQRMFYGDFGLPWRAMMISGSNPRSTASTNFESVDLASSMFTVCIRFTLSQG